MVARLAKIAGFVLLLVGLVVAIPAMVLLIPAMWLLRRDDLPELSQPLFWW